MKNFIGNASHVCDWPALLERVKSRPGIHRDNSDNDGYNKVIYNEKNTLRRQKRQELEYDYLRDPDHELNRAYGDKNNINFNTYDPASGDYNEKDYGVKLAKWLDCKYILSWISEVSVGTTVPAHVDDEEVYHALERTKLPVEKLVRYHVHLSPPSYGAVFIVEDAVYHMANQGDVFQWPSADSIHLGLNGSSELKLTYHFMGYKENE